MNLPPLHARALGILFLLPFLFYGIGTGLITGILEEPAHLTTAVSQRTPFIGGVLLLLLNSLTVAGIGALFFPILREQSLNVALVYVCTRVMEALLLLVGVIFLLSVLQLGELSQGQPTPELELLFKLLSKGNFWAYQLAMIILGTGSVVFCLSLYRSRLLPSFLSLAGAGGYGLLALGAVLELFGRPWGVFLSGPGGLFELSLGGWLIARSFRTLTPCVAV